MQASLLVLSFCIGAGPFETTDAADQRDQIKAAINQLSAKEYAQRQSAMERLWAAGEVSIPLLEGALRSKDAETRYRAEFVLNHLNMGITFDTPKSVLIEVRRFQSDSIEHRRYAMRQLERVARPRLVLGLIQSEGDQRLRDEWSQSLERNLVHAISRGRIDEVGDTLRRSADREIWMRHWSAFAMQRGLSGTEASRVVDPNESESDRQLRQAYLLRAQGKLAEACGLAGQLPEDLQVALFVENHQWQEAAQLVAGRLSENWSSEDLDIESVSEAAAYYRLAGQQKECDRWLDQLKAAADQLVKELGTSDTRRRDGDRQSITRAWHMAKGLLLNGRYDQAIEIVRENQPTFVFDLLCQQQRYDEAFAAVGHPFPQGPTVAWYEEVAKASGSNFHNDQQLSLAVAMIQKLWFLGHRERALDCFQILMDSAHEDRGIGRLRLLCETAKKISLDEDARHLAAEVFARDDASNIFSVLYPQDSSLAAVWFEHFRRVSSAESLEESFTRVDSILRAGSYAEKTGDLENLITSAGDVVSQLDESKKIDGYRELGETALRHRRKDLALRFFTRAADSSQGAAMRVADIQANAGNWSEAARWYERAWRMNEQRPLALYLQGRMLQRLGDVETGNQLLERALLMPLANTEIRHELAAGLKERGYRDEALEQYEILLRTGEFNHGKSIDAAKQVGNLIHTRDELRAADCWQTMLLSCLKPNWGFVENGGYVQIPQLIHKTRAKGLLEAGRFDEAIREAWAGYRASPGDADYAEELIPLLEAAGRKAEADELFVRVANDLRELSEMFPQCATFQNNRAWLLARCNRDLDDAQASARRAVELDPRNLSFMDTLAEVHFRRGEKEQALDYMAQCLKADPNNQHFHSQFERFGGTKASP